MICKDEDHRFVWLYKRVRNEGTQKYIKSEILQCKKCRSIINKSRIMLNEGTQTNAEHTPILHKYKLPKEINEVFENAEV